MGSQIAMPTQPASSPHVPGSVLHAPQPCAVPGGAHADGNAVQSAWSLQHNGDGHPSSGHGAGVCASEMQPRNPGEQSQPAQVSSWQTGSTRQSASESPAHGGLSPEPHAASKQATTSNLMRSVSPRRPALSNNKL